MPTSEIPTSDIAKLIIDIEEAVHPESEYYGKPIKWWEQDKRRWHYGIGLSNTQFFNIGTKEAQELKVLQRHDTDGQQDRDIRLISDIRSPFEADEIIERLKYALRWLYDLPVDSSHKSISGKGLTGLIFEDNDEWKYQETEPIHNEIDYKNYLRLQSPSLKYSKFSLTKKGKIWANIFLGILFILVFAIVVLTDTISIPWFEVHKDEYQQLKKLLSYFVPLLIFVVFISIPNLISSFKWSGFQKKSFWDWLQLLVVPLILAIGAFYLNYASAARDKKLAYDQKLQDEEIAKNQKQQDVFKTYLSQMQNLVLKDADKVQSNFSPKYKALATALTLTALDELDGEHKGKVIAYLAKSDLIKRDSPEVDLANANLQGIKLKNIDIDNVKIWKADLTNADLTDVTFHRSDLQFSIFSNAKLNKVAFLTTLLNGANFDAAKFIHVKIIPKNVPFVCYSDKTTFQNSGDTDILEITKKDFENVNVIKKLKSSEEECNTTIRTRKKQLNY